MTTTNPVSVDQHAALLEQSQRGATAAHLLEFHEKEVLPEQEKSIRKRIFALIDDSNVALEPDIAVQAWIELRAAYKLTQRLGKLKRRGEVANLSLADSPIEPTSNQ